MASHECGCGTLAQVLARCWCPLAVATSEWNTSVPHGVEDGGKHMSSIGDVKNCPVSVTVWRISNVFRDKHIQWAVSLPPPNPGNMSGR